MPEVSPGEADPQPAEGSRTHVLPGLRLRAGPADGRPARRRPLALALAAAAGAAGLLWLANPPVDAGPLAFVALVPLFWAIRTAGPRRGAALGFVFGVVYYGLLLRWLSMFGAIAEWPLVLAQAAYAALFGAVASSLARSGRPVRSALVIAATWTAVDWARGAWPLGGFTWGGLGYTQHANPLLRPLASVTGVWGVTFVVALANDLVLAATAHVRERGRERWSAFVMVAVAAAAAMLPALIPSVVHQGPGLDVAVVQGNVPRELASDRLLQSTVVGENHIRLNRTLASDPPDLTVWPENALAEDPTADPVLGQQVQASIAAVGAPTLVGAIGDRPGGGFVNQVLLYDRNGDVISRYTKVHLVPFGEYVPWRSVLGWTERYRRGLADLVPGDGVRVLRVGSTLIGTPICFENTFPDLFRQFVADGANLMVVATNDSSFLLTEASREHVIFSQLRAVETGRWIVQAAISGESAILAPDGRVTARTGLFQQTILRASVPVVTGTTLYVRFGDWFPWVCGLAVVAMLAMGFVRRRRAGTTRPDQALPPPAGEPATRARSAAPIRGGAEPRVMVVLPTYNERPTIASVLAEVTSVGPNVHAMVVDDNSPDGTADVVADLAASEPRIELIRRSGKLGLASAYLTGFERALQAGYDVVVEMDADLSHRPQDLPCLLEGATRWDLTIGSRYVPGGGVSNWSRARLALSKTGNAYARAMLRIPVSDATSGYRAYRRDVLAALIRYGVHSEGYAFQVELVYRAHRLGYSIGEVPITFREREHGHSKISRAIVIEALLRVGEWGIRDRLRGLRTKRP